jgi:hypothetical protein
VGRRLNAEGPDLLVARSFGSGYSNPQFDTGATQPNFCVANESANLPCGAPETQPGAHRNRDSLWILKLEGESWKDSGVREFRCVSD